MSERGVFAVSRSIWDDPDFDSEPFTQREAMMWLVSAAAWTDRSVRGAAGPIVLARGEFCFSVRFLADRWRWSKSRVARFLDVLEKRDTIRDAKRDGAKVYSIKNYNKFQVVGLPERDSKRDANRDASGTAAGQQRDKEETLKHSNIESIRTALRAVLDDDRAKAVIEHRRKIGSPLTAHAAKLLAGELGKAPDANSAADTMMARGWRGFKLEWLERDQSQAPPQSAGYRQNGSGGYAKPGSREFVAWHQEYKRQNSSRQWEFEAAMKSGNEVHVPDRFPRRTA